MPENETETQVTCELCGRVVPETPDGAEGISLEVQGRGPDGKWTFWDPEFCSQEHAAEWLSRPLPPSPVLDAAEVPTSWSDRAAASGCVLVLVALVALVVLGGWTVVDFVVG